TSRRGEQRLSIEEVLRPGRAGFGQVRPLDLLGRRAKPLPDGGARSRRARLPCGGVTAMTAPAPASAPTTEPQGGGTGRLLISCDDQPGIVAAVAAFLRERG